MLTHAQIWAAIDALAEREGTSASGLARRAGLDATTFNRSKRQNDKGQLRWPSTESIAKVLAATGIDIDEFLALRKPADQGLLPCRVLKGSALGWFTPEGKPQGQGWDEVGFPGFENDDNFGLEISGKKFLPFYREGDILILEPSIQPRRGDRMLLILRDGAVRVETFIRQAGSQFHFTAIDRDEETRLSRGEIAHLFRIRWASQ
ncbi:MAG TPA: helix-turn-helix transcriptional regulator [Rhabdaerophilum sp.]|nr:helix-turn-helix transcriptional regulator [Rhabdaerophilum sp.]